MDNKFTKKLAAYSAAAVAVISLGTKADAQVVYSGVKNINLAIGGTETYDLDLDTNATVDFTLGVVSSSVFQSAFINQALTNYWMTTMSGSQAYLQHIDPDNPIGAAQTNWGNYFFQWNIGWFASSSSLNTHGFLGGGDQLIGLKFNIGTAVHYGWARINVSPNASSMVIVDWAYESTPDSTILAGDVGAVGINQPTTSENISVFCFNNQLNVNCLNMNQKGNIQIVNLMGQEIKTVNITDSKMVIDLNDLAAGIYVANINNGDNKISRKFNLK